MTAASDDPRSLAASRRGCGRPARVHVSSRLCWGPGTRGGPGLGPSTSPQGSGTCPCPRTTTGMSCAQRVRDTGPGRSVRPPPRLRGARCAPPPRDPLAPTTCSSQAAPGAGSLPPAPAVRFPWTPANSHWSGQQDAALQAVSWGGGGEVPGTGTADSLDEHSQGQRQSGRCLPGSNVLGHRLHSGLHLRFRQQKGHRKQPPYRGACMSSVLRGPWPPEFHASQGADNPRKGLLPEPKHFVQLRLLVPQLGSGAPHRAPGLGSSVPLKGPDGTLCPCSWVCMTPDLA